tara:strand:- start:169 stop:444 length:276 start_codon:yes stop_codon:yes gene_type:complete
MPKKSKRNHYWNLEDITKHRISKIINAIQRRDSDYMEERQKKLSRIIPNSFFAEARIEFISDTTIQQGDMNIPNKEEDALKTHQNMKGLDN